MENTNLNLTSIWNVILLPEVKHVCALYPNDQEFATLLATSRVLSNYGFLTQHCGDYLLTTHEIKSKTVGKTYNYHFGWGEVRSIPAFDCVEVKDGDLAIIDAMTWLDEYGNRIIKDVLWDSDDEQFLEDLAVAWIKHYYAKLRKRANSAH